MTKITRRDALIVGAGAVAGASLGASGAFAQAQAPAWTIKPEKGATLRVLRPSKFVQGDETQWLANTKKYTDTTGVQVKVESESWEDLRPKSAVAFDAMCNIVVTSSYEAAGAVGSYVGTVSVFIRSRVSASAVASCCTSFGKSTISSSSSTVW